MTLKARTVLADCRNAFDLLEDETRPEVFRLYWVAGVALARAVGHVLQKVDSRKDQRLRQAVDSAYKDWKARPQENAIFWEFIEQERNQILKKYASGFLAGPIDVVAAGATYSLDEHLFCPMVDGPFAGEDCRDVLGDALAWWEKQLDTIEAVAREPRVG